MFLFFIFFLHLISAFSPILGADSGDNPNEKKKALTVIFQKDGIIKTKSFKPLQEQSITSMSVTGQFVNECSLESYFKDNSFEENSIEKEKKQSYLSIKIEEETIPDKRKEVPSPSKWPWSVHGLVKSDFDEEKVIGTGTLIAPNLVLTAAHNLYSLKKDQAAIKVTFYPAFSKEKQSSSTVPNDIESKYYFFPNQFTKSKKIEGENRWETEDDYGLLVLDKPIGEKVGYFGLAILPPKEIIEKDTGKNLIKLNVTGYPDDKGRKMHEMEGDVTNIYGEDYVEYRIRTDYGQSGGGVWYKEDKGQKESDYFVIGVHVKGTENKTSSYATLLTQSRFEQIEQWVEESIKKRIADERYGEVEISNLGGQRIGYYGVREIFETRPHYLHTLILENNDIGDEGAIVFSLGFDIPTLTHLNLGNNHISDAGAQALFQAWNKGNIPYLFSLNLRDNSIDTAIQELLRISTLSKLNLAGNKISYSALDQIAMYHADSFKNSRLTYLNLGRNSIDKLGAKVLYYICKESSLKLADLKLGKNLINDDGLNALLNISTLNKLNLAYNHIQLTHINSESMLETLATHPTLSKLNLKSNHIKDAGAQAISKTLARNTTLSKLNLKSNRIKDAGAQAISKTLARNTTLTKLNLQENKIKTSILKEFFNTRNLLSLSVTVNKMLCKENFNLTCNTLSMGGINDALDDDLIEALCKNTTLTNLGLEVVGINAPFINIDNSFFEISGMNFCLGRVLRENNTITKLNFNFTGLKSHKGSNVSNSLCQITCFDDKGLNVLSEALSQNSTLTELNLLSTGIHDDGVKSINISNSNVQVTGFLNSSNFKGIPTTTNTTLIRSNTASMFTDSSIEFMKKINKYTREPIRFCSFSSESKKLHITNCTIHVADYLLESGKSISEEESKNIHEAYIKMFEIISSNKKRKPIFQGNLLNGISITFDYFKPENMEEDKDIGFFSLGKSRKEAIQQITNSKKIMEIRELVLPEIISAFKKGAFPSFYQPIDYIEKYQSFQKGTITEDEIKLYCLKKNIFANFIWHRYNNNLQEMSYSILDAFGQINNLEVYVWYLKENQETLGILHYFSPIPPSDPQETIHLLKRKSCYKRLMIMGHH